MAEASGEVVMVPTPGGEVEAQRMGRAEAGPVVRSVFLGIRDLLWQLRGTGRARPEAGRRDCGEAPRERTVGAIAARRHDPDLGSHHAPDMPGMEGVRQHTGRH